MNSCPANEFRVGQTWRNSRGYLWHVEWSGFGRVYLRAEGSGRKISKEVNSIPDGWVLVEEFKYVNSFGF